MFFEGEILPSKSFKMLVNLPHEISSFEILEWEIVELEDIEVALDIPGILILLKFSFGDLTIQVPDNLVYQPGNIQGEQVDNLVEDSSACVIVDSHKLEDCY